LSLGADVESRHRQLVLLHLSHLTEQAECVVSEQVTNAVNASTRDGKPLL
jgi:hypothetical protein